MTNERPNVEAVFSAAIEIEVAEERRAFLDRACDGDPELRRRADRLLRAHFEAGGFLEVPAAGRVDPPIAEKPVTSIGPYKLLEKIGEGGFGDVWVAEQRQPIKRRVAVKVIKLGMDTRQVVARFEAERQALALMDHPNIAKVLDAGATDTGGPYFVMELVRGIPITRFCDEAKLNIRGRLDLFIKICQAIQHAHQKGIIHRDIKPSNVLVTLHDGVAVPKVIDFGIAKATQQELTEKTVYTRFHDFLGTPAYMSPEQVEMSGLDIDTRSDIYSLGVLLYELLTGTTPFSPEELLEAGIDEMRRTIRAREPPTPSTMLTRGLAAGTSGPEKRASSVRLPHLKELIRLLRGDLDWVVMKALEKDRTRRYQSASDLAADIQRHLANEAVTARPPGVLYRFQKLVRRNKVAFSAAGAVVIALVIGLFISVWQAIEAEMARDRAQRAQESAEEQREHAERQGAIARRHLYAASLNLAQQAWERNNAGRVLELLAETETHSERGFEWYYWQRQVRLELRALRGHVGRVWAVAFSPDGRRIVTGSWDQTAKVWEADTGEEVITLEGHAQMVASVAFSPDGRRIVTGSWDQTAKVWDADTGEEVITLEGHSAVIHSVAFSSDGQWIVSGGEDETVRLWEAATGEELRILEGHGARIWSVALSPNGRRVVTGSRDRKARVWDVDTGRPVLTLSGHAAGIRAVAFSADGERIATASEDHTARLWAADSGEELRTFREHLDAVVSVAFSPDGRRIATGSWDRTARVWDADTGEEVVLLRGHIKRVRSVAFSPDGTMLATGSSDGTARVWAPAVTAGLTLRGHDAAIAGLGFSSNGGRIVSGSFDRSARVWDGETGHEVLRLKGHNDRVWSVAFSPDGRRIVTGSWDQTVRVWDAGTGGILFTLVGHGAGIRCVAFSPDGRRILTGSEDHTARLWDGATGRHLLTLAGHGDLVFSAAFSPDGELIVTASGDRTARVWDSVTGRESLTLEGHDAAVRCVAFAPDGRHIVTGSWNGTAVVWDADTGEELLTLQGHTRGIEALAFTPDGFRVATGSSDRTVKLWDAATGRELLTLDRYGAAVRSVAFSPDGFRMIVGGEDGTAVAFEAASPEQVEAWRQEEHAAEERLEALRSEQRGKAERERALRARDPGAVRTWLLLGPLSFEGESGASAVDKEQIEDEGRLRPRTGERVVVGGRELVWRAVHVEDYSMDFNQLLGEQFRYVVAYAVCYIRSGAERRDLTLNVGSDDQARIYLNGNEVYRRVLPRPFVADRDVVRDVALKGGLNVLVFKLLNETDAWQGSVRLADGAGRPVDGIEVVLTPE